MPEEKEKSQADLLRDELMPEPKHASEVFSPERLAEINTFCEGYKAFLNKAKTEREACTWFLERAKSAGFVPFEPSRSYAPGSKVYAANRGKSIVLAVVGTESPEAGLRITAAHIDSPRLDLKPAPFYEDGGLALAKTHYYGGIKKYQWTVMPIALHGVICKKDGTTIELRVGEDADDPKFCVSDLLPHLAEEQMKRTLSKGIAGEELNIIMGSRPLVLDGKSEGFKLNLLKILHDKYGVTEADFRSAELEAVPAYLACDVGFDRGLIGAYGQDDRVCAYPCAEALFHLTDIPTHTAVCVLADKEEIGSYGNTGLTSNAFADFVKDFARGLGANPRNVLRNSKCLSADVNAAFDPTFPSVMDSNNAAYCNQGVVVTKYTGSRGKSGSSDASAEFVAWVRKLLDDANVLWQMGELGKVDEGGGGTVAAELAMLNLDVVDVGVPILSMHAPFELSAKADVAMLRDAAEAFYQA
jgi:aspartyl aminopeptidase